MKALLRQGEQFTFNFLLHSFHLKMFSQKLRTWASYFWARFGLDNLYPKALIKTEIPTNWYRSNVFKLHFWAFGKLFCESIDNCVHNSEYLSNLKHADVTTHLRRYLSRENNYVPIGLLSKIYVFIFYLFAKGIFITKFNLF